MARRTDGGRWRSGAARALIAGVGLGAFFVAIGALAAAPGGEAMPAPEGHGGEPATTVLTLGSGNSRGAYQAGVVYALLHDRQLRRLQGREPEPLAIAGASVGAVNGLAAAAEECSVHEGGLPSPEQSLFWKLWQAFDWDAMFPGASTCDEYGQSHPEIAPICTGDAPFDAGDGLLTSNQTRIVAKMLLTAFNSPTFRADCDLPVAISLLGSTALPIDSKDSKLGAFTVESSRRLFTVTLNPKATATTTAGGNAPAPVQPTTLWVSPFELPRGTNWWESLAAELRPLIVPRVARTPDSFAIPLTSLIDVATSAISQPPYLLTPPLVACDVSCPAVAAAAEGLCPAGQNPCADHYYDASLFDHIPLAGAILLRPRNARYVIIDPSSSANEKRQADDLSKVRGSAFVLKAAGDLIGSASDYQLQLIERMSSRLPEAQRPDVRKVDRTLPLAGTNVLGFGGYIDRRFRYHDYYAGIVDGLFWTAAQACPGCSAAQVAARVVQRYRGDLIAWDTPESETHADLRRSAGLLQVLLTTVEARLCPSAVRSPDCDAIENNLRRLGNDVTARATQQVSDASARAELAPAADRLAGTTLAASLRKAGFDRNLPFVTSHPYWWAETLRQVAARANVIESGQGSPSTAAAFGFAEYAASVGVQRFTPGFQLGPATIPARIYGSGLIPGLEKALVPAVLATDVLGGGRIAWEAATYRLPVAPEWKLGTAGAVLEWLRYRDLPETVVAGPSLSTSYEFYNAWVSELGVRAWWHRWSGPVEGDGLAGEIFLRPLWGRAEIAVGTSQIGCNGPCRRAGLFVTLGVADFNGLLYWGLRGFTGSDSAYNQVASEIKDRIPVVP